MHGLDDIGPVIYYKFIYLVYKGVLEDELGAEVFKGFRTYFKPEAKYASLLRNDSSRWWDNKLTTAINETRGQISHRSFECHRDCITKPTGK